MLQIYHSYKFHVTYYYFDILARNVLNIFVKFSQYRHKDILNPQKAYKCLGHQF